MTNYWYRVLTELLTISPAILLALIQGAGKKAYPVFAREPSGFNKSIRVCMINPTDNTNGIYLILKVLRAL